MMKNNYEDKGIVGYTGGTFDLFHIGHLNLLKRAKEQCDYLVVGCIDDESAHFRKGKKPIVPIEERIEILAALSCVDEVIITHQDQEGNNSDLEIKLAVDKVFIGDDYRDSKEWVELERQIVSGGGSVVFLPYTQHTSSTKIRRVIDIILSESND